MDHPPWEKGEATSNCIGKRSPLAGETRAGDAHGVGSSLKGEPVLRIFPWKAIPSRCVFRGSIDSVRAKTLHAVPSDGSIFSFTAVTCPILWDEPRCEWQTPALTPRSLCPSAPA